MQIIVGDSWACGEWTDSREHSLAHRGIVQYLKDEDSEQLVVPLGLAGSSNFASANRLDFFLDAYQYTCGSLSVNTIILFFITEWIRDFRLIPDCDLILDNSKNYSVPDFDEDFISTHVSKTCYRLSDIAQKYNCKIGLIGGTSDTMWLDKFSHEYPGLFIACQSWTNLLLNDDHRIDSPVFSVTLDPNLYIQAKQQKKYQLMSHIEYHNDLANTRLNQWTNNQNWFYPDGSHPNRSAHKKLYNYLKSQNIL